MKSNPFLCKSILQFDRQLRSIRYHLKALRDDILLIKDGWQINYAIDYCELYRYAFGSCSLLNTSTGRLPSSMKRDDYVNKSYGTNLLLSNPFTNSRLILLPPYAIELLRFIPSLHQHAAKAALQMAKIKELFDSKTDQLNILQQVYDYRHKNPLKQLPKGLQGRLARYLIMNYREILFLSMATAEEGINALRKLIVGNNPKIMYYEKAWPDLCNILYDISESIVKGSQWYLMFNILRNRPASDFFDAQALEIIDRLNNRITSQKQVVLLYSDAPTMTRALNYDLLHPSPPNIEPKPKGYIMGIKTKSAYFSDQQYRILRTPRTFLFYGVCLGEDYDETLSNINIRLNEVERYYPVTRNYFENIRNSCKYYKKEYGEISVPLESYCKRCPVRHNMQDIAKDIVRYNEFAIQYENASLYLNQSKLVYKLKLKGDKLRRIFDRQLAEAVEDFADNIKKDTFNINDDIRRRQRTIMHKINSLRDEVGRGAIKYASPFAISSLSHKIDKFLRVYALMRFRNKAITQTVRVFEETKLQHLDINSRRTNEIQNALMKLINIAYASKKPSVEGVLIRAILAYIYGEYDYAREIIARELSSFNHNSEDLFRLRFIKCLTTHSSGLSLNDSKIIDIAMLESKELMDEFPKKARSYHLYGFLAIRSKKRIKGRTIGLDHILNILETALELANGEDRSLRAAILNNYIYAIYQFKRNSETMAEIAYQKYEVLKKLVDEMNNWPVNYLDTFGCVMLLTAKYCKNKYKAKKFLNSAITYFSKAKEYATAYGAPEQDILPMHYHLKSAKYWKTKLGID
ncbi:MAG: hypothetical protein AB1746_02195 [Candidatus Zixiibacteriota bacterium]